MIQKIDESVARYVAREASTVPGYLRSLDLSVLSVLGQHQTARGTRGGLLEIGVHHGKLFLLLARMRQAGERALGVDLFEDDAYNRRGRHSDRSTALMRNAARLGVPLDPEEVLRSDSTLLDAADIVDRIGAPRLVSIDGGHDYDVVRSDLALTAQVLAPEGVIAVDDYLNSDWPDVALATDEFLAINGNRFGAFLLTPGKLYIAEMSWLAHYAAIIDDHPGFAKMLKSRVMIGKQDVPFMRLLRRQALGRRLADLLQGTLHRTRRENARDGMGGLIRALAFAGLG